MLNTKIITYGSKAEEIKPIITKCLNQIYENIKSFTPIDIFDSLTIEICDPDNINCPSDIKKSAGLTWYQYNLIQLNTTVFEYKEDIEKYYSNLLSHEFGHYWSNKVGFNNNNYIRTLWDNLRGINSTNDTPKHELIAEDFRLLFGSNKARFFERGSYLQANKVKGLRDLYLIWDKFNKKIKSIAWFRYITNNSFNYSNIDFNYLEISIESRNIFLWFDRQIDVVSRTSV